MSEQTLFEKYGGAETMKKLVNKFYEGVLANDKVKHFFVNTDMDKLKAHQATFIGMALGGPKTYTGRDMRAAHDGMGLTDEHFDAIVDELTNAMDSLGVSEEDITKVIEIVETTRDDCLLR